MVCQVIPYFCCELACEIIYLINHRFPVKIKKEEMNEKIQEIEIKLKSKEEFWKEFQCNCCQSRKI